MKWWKCVSLAGAALAAAGAGVWLAREVNLRRAQQGLTEAMGQAPLRPERPQGPDEQMSARQAAERFGEQATAPRKRVFYDQDADLLFPQAPGAGDDEDGDESEATGANIEHSEAADVATEGGEAADADAEGGEVTSADAQHGEAAAGDAERGTQARSQSEGPLRNPVEAPPVQAPRTPDGKLDAMRIASAEDFQDWDEWGCKA